MHGTVTTAGDDPLDPIASSLGGLAFAVALFPGDTHIDIEAASPTGEDSASHFRQLRRLSVEDQPIGARRLGHPDASFFT